MAILDAIDPRTPAAIEERMHQFNVAYCHVNGIIPAMPEPPIYTLKIIGKERDRLIAALVYLENMTCEDYDVPSEHVAAIRGFRRELENTLPDNRRIA